MRSYFVTLLAMPLLATADDMHIANLVAEAFVTFDTLDTNADGSVSHAEFEDYVLETAADYFLAGDTNGDGVIDKAEFSSWDVFAEFELPDEILGL